MLFQIALSANKITSKRSAQASNRNQEHVKRRKIRMVDGIVAEIGRIRSHSSPLSAEETRTWKQIVGILIIMG